MRPTLNDIAVKAGVSRSTVSLVIRNEGHISPKTRARVRQVIADLGYVYHRGAASIRGRSTRSIGVIAPDATNPFMAELTAAFEQQLDTHGFTVFTCHTYEKPDRQAALIRALLERGVDAILLMPAVGSEEQLTCVLETVDVPVVIVVRPVPGSSLTFVGSDNRLGASLAAEHLIQHGSRTIGYVGGPAALSLRADRLNGAMDVISRSSAELIVDLPSDPTGSAGRAAMHTLIEADSIPEAIICHNDSTAFGVSRALRNAGGERGSNVRIIGFDDVAEAELWEPPLTTVATNAEEVGDVAAQQLARSLSGQSDISSIQIRPKLVIRSSCGEHSEAPVLHSVAPGAS